MTFARRLSHFALVTLVAFGCESSGAPSGPAASGLAPRVEFDVTFGEPPLAGTLHLTPFANSVGWRYRIEGLGDAPAAGAIDAPISLSYRFDALGSHRIRVELIGPDDPVVVEKRLVVTDPESDFEVLDLLPVEEIWPEAGPGLHPEGIVLDPRAVELYVANYPSGEVVRVDAGDLEPFFERRVHLAPGVEGLGVTPSGQRLLAAHKQSMFSVAGLRDAAPNWEQQGIGEYYVEVLDESHTLVSGFPLVSVNLDQRRVEHEAGAFHARHFAVDRSRGRVAVADLTNEAIEILDLPSLSTLRTIPLDLHPLLVAFDPEEDKAYVVAEDDAGLETFLVLDPSSGATLNSTSIGPGGCSGYCVANPVATFGGGRYIAFEQSSSVLVVDTALDQPRYRFGSPPVGVVGGPAGVTAQPDSDILYVLGGPYDALTKIRLRDR